MEPIKRDLNVTANAAQSYAAVATSAGIKKWWAKNSDVGEAVGSKMELRFTKPEMSAVMNFDVTDLDPGHRVEWTCTQNSNPIWPTSRMSWLFEPTPSGSIIHFSHYGLTDNGPLYEATVQGWDFFLDSLRAYLSGGTPYPSD